MHAAVGILQKIARPVSEYVDVRNLRNVLLAAQALVSGRRLVLMELARHWPGAERVLGPLKRLDRLLGNAGVHRVRERFYQVAAAWLLRCEQPVLVVDWSDLKRDGRWALLRAGVVTRGRTMTVYEEVHPRKKCGNRRVHAAFLKRLHALLPPSVRPIVLTDAGFKNPWFEAVQALGWHWIGRVRHRTKLRRLCANAKSDWIKCKTLYALALPKACSLGEALLARAKPLQCRLVLVRSTRRGRVDLTRLGKRAQSSASRKMAQRVREPWLLALSCSLNEWSASAVVALYAKRMQIEQSFRDLKSHRYGCAFDDTLTRSAQRLEMLLLIHMLAALAAWLVGLAATARAHARVCTSALLNRYSVLWIGWACLRHGAASSGTALLHLASPPISDPPTAYPLLAQEA
jgi:hypothetical protein